MWSFHDIIVLVLSSFYIFFPDPLYDIPTPIRQAIDYSLLSFFATEVGAKMFAYGLLVPSGVSPRTVQFPEGKPAFFSNSEEGGWNALDAVFILIMLMDMPFIPVSTGNFKVIRIVRIVRPMARNSSKVKTLLASLFASIKSILNVINLFALLVLIYGLLGVQLFKVWFILFSKYFPIAQGHSHKSEIGTGQIALLQ